MLNGSLDTVALPDVLRLISSSGKSGLIRIEDASPSGRIFIVDGRVAFATNRNEDDPIDDLLNMEYRADYVGSPEDRRIVDLNDLLENNAEAFTRFLEQMIVEVLSRLLRVNEGQFRFDLDIRSRREIPYSFDVEDMISQAATRAEAWTRIFDVVPSAVEPFRMAPRLDEAEEVLLGRRDWALLAATGSSTTINDIAQRLKIFEFAAAKKVAELTERGLIEFISTELPHESMAAAEFLSEVVELAPVDTEESREDSPELESPPEPKLEADVGDEEEAVEDEPVTGSGSGAADADSPPDGAGPTWLPVEETPEEENQEEEEEEDPVRLLEELHRLHEADAAESQQAAETTEVDEDAPEEQEFDIDDIEGGDLATRWKNLRKAKRGVHAANE